RPEGATSARRVVLATERLLLEPVGPGHAARIYDVVVASRPELLPWMPWARNPTLESTLAMSQRDERAWQDDRVYQFVLVDKASGEVLGVAGMNRESEDAAELPYWIPPARRGRGPHTQG